MDKYLTKKSRSEIFFSWLNTRHATISLSVIVPILLGLYSVYLGPDANWDLYNYHRYGPFALLNGKIGVDLGVGGVQGYFNPFLDFYPLWLNQQLPPVVAGFTQGLVHGVAFVLVLGIARRVLVNRPAEDANRLPLLLALCGCATANFLSEIGTSMGDNTTALFVLVGVYILLSRWEKLDRLEGSSLAAICLSGTFVGLAVGLKLTNGVSAVSLCFALLVCSPGSVTTRFRTSFLFGLSTLFGFAIFGGTWMVLMWNEFGNPLFPQFSNVFPNPLAQPMSVADARWLPRGIAEYLLWPFILSIDARRVGELPFRQIIWAIVYTLSLIWIAKRLASKFWSHSSISFQPQAVFVIVYVVTAFVVWTKIFSIYRYTVAFEMLSPLVAFLILTDIFSYARARKISQWLLALSAAVVITGGARTWGHEEWASPLYHTSLTSLEHQEDATVLLVNGDRPLGWLPTLFPSNITFFGIETGFPGSDEYARRVRSGALSRGGPIYVFTDGEDDRRTKKMESFDVLAGRLGLTHTQSGCRVLRFIVDRMRFRAAVEPVEGTGQLCRLAVRPADVVDIDRSNRERIQFAADKADAFGFALKADTCQPFTAGIGGGNKSYLSCSADMR